MTWQMNVDPLGNIGLSALVAAIPIFFLFWALAIKRMKGQYAALGGTGLALLIAVTVYGMPAYADRAAAVGEVHARPHLLIQAPRGILQLAFMTEGDQARDQMAMSELSHRFAVAEPDLATPLHGLTWDEGRPALRKAH